MRPQDLKALLLVFISLLLFGLNFFYSVYALKVLKEHTNKLNTYMSLREENLQIRSKIERILSLEKLKDYARRHGFKDFDWDKFVLDVIREPSKRDLPKGRGGSRNRRR